MARRTVNRYRACPGSGQLVDHECGANFCPVCEKPVKPMNFKKPIAPYHVQASPRECECGNGIWTDDYLCVPCRLDFDDATQAPIQEKKE